MSEAEEPRRCATCTTPIPPRFPDGLCPRCLLAAGAHVTGASGSSWSGQGGAADEGGRSTGDWQAVFPELEILGPLGAGGMGVVFKARQPRLDRTVALKIMACPPGGPEDFALRFEQEARVLARLGHPNIVPIYDFGERQPEGATGPPVCYFLMEHVDGGDLGELLRQGPLDQATCLAVARQICAALEYAHGLGVIHRDIKPSNILLDKEGRVKLADFGLARMGQDGRDGLAFGLTRTGAAMGTPDYMAPEQKLGRGDHRVDIYALGVVLYEMLCGNRPQGVWKSPSRKSGVDTRLDRIVSRALQEEPEQRYQQAGDMRRDLEAVAGRPMPGQAAAQGVRAKRVLAGLAVGCLAVGGAYWYHGDRDSRTGPIGATRIPSAAGEPAASLPTATASKPWKNSLGMEFLPVPATGILLCANETTEADWSVFIKTSGYAWERFDDPTVSGRLKPGEHPIGGVSWDDAQAFCAWLTEKEQRGGQLSAGLCYRLPIDHEWSTAAGLEENLELPPRELSGRKPGYVWGKAWPPPRDVVNVGDTGAWPEGVTEATFQEKLKEGIRLVDDFEETCPVRRFPPNEFGFYGVTGNVAEWVWDKWERGHSAAGFRVLRGGGWFTPAKGGMPWLLRFNELARNNQLFQSTVRSRRDPSEWLKLSNRESSQPGERWPQNGFRVALTDARQSLPDWQEPLEPGVIVNSLGMHLLPVGGAGDSKPVVYLSRWETRVRDYTAFAGETGRAWAKPGFPQSPEHPAVMVSLDDCLAFCEWLTARERKSGAISQDQAYRLPTPGEWRAALWPTDWLHPMSVGLRDWTDNELRENVMDACWVRAVRKEPHWASEQRVNDGHVFTAPVGSYAGLHPRGDNGPDFYDVGGNVSERTVAAADGGPPRAAPNPGNAFLQGNWNEFLLDKALPDEPREDIGFRVLLGPRADRGP